MAIKDYVLKVGDFVLPNPSTYKVSYEVLDLDSGRNANGDMQRNILGTKVKIQTIFPMSTDEKTFRQLLQLTSQYEFLLEFYDIKKDSYRLIKVYTGTETPDIYTIQNGKLIMNELAINFIEY